ncbi:hypothetical protein HETIRDRAFT_447115 [Heterobasidion irregulare TC 32-1]|uniref:DNA polymerase lambda fingers domain-containing protein n=1 Tax=Heterobasidion irregulare (strain TC 32-1) TaxID=747525 RepID=W4JMW1_HETIT|nr:uncharacterized protein HETIRDRAFT_447115 [Heterobasidion irregulare TC 32-1]ETW74868.1 hypothetical protein HETIRDRAFT_447115 [Heterobasidion irregulare TC 32-1]
MPLKRPNSPAQRASSSSSESQTPSEIQIHPSKKTRLSAPTPTTSVALKGLKVHILDAKLDSVAIAEILALLVRCGAKACQTAVAADVVVTAVTMRKRLERHMDWEAAVSGLLPPARDTGTAHHLRRTVTIASRESDSSARLLTRSAVRSLARLSPPRVPAHLLPPAPPPAFDAASLDSDACFSCLRASPLVCANQGLCEQLDAMRRARELEGEERSALSYRRAVSVIKGTLQGFILLEAPWCSARQRPIYNIYPTFAAPKVEQYMTTGQIVEVQATLASPRFHALETLSTVYGIGATTARNLYALGLRTVEDLHKYYEVRLPSRDANDSAAVADEPGQALLRGAVIDLEEDGEEPWMKIALGLREDLGKKIPRSEVEEIHRVIISELETVQPGCVSTIIGGLHAHVILVGAMGWRTDGTAIGVESRRATTWISCSRIRTTCRASTPTTHWASLEKALTVFVLPSADSGGGGGRVVGGWTSSSRSRRRTGRRSSAGDGLDDVRARFAVLGEGTA